MESTAEVSKARPIVLCTQPDPDEQPGTAQQEGRRDHPDQASQGDEVSHSQRHAAYGVVQPGVLPGVTGMLPMPMPIFGHPRLPMHWGVFRVRQELEQ